ncbi:glycosyltransferase family 4 protein, partial [Escherichia coli]|nr:glycosyltransferase family 4 protein [Escherichia coli]
FDHPSLGKTFETDEDFAPALIDYIKSEVPRDQKVLESKLYDISSTHFGEAMIEFYEDMIIYHEKEMQRKEEEASIERIKIKLNSFKR